MDSKVIYPENYSKIIGFRDVEDMSLFLKYALIFNDFRFLKFKNKDISTVVRVLGNNWNYTLAQMEKRLWVKLAPKLSILVRTVARLGRMSLGSGRVAENQAQVQSETPLLRP